MSAVYNENDPYAAQWLRNLIAKGLIAPGEVDERSICDVGDGDYRSFTQVHLFAGIGGWSLAARIAGLPDDFPIWTGSCPCQPFSAAGKQAGTADARHLWPEMRRLLAECRPAVVAGEQVASKLGRGWLAGVRADLEALGYAVGAADLCAAGEGAPHIRQRLFWVADAVRGRAEHPSRQGVGAQAAADSEDRGLPGQRLRPGIEGPTVRLGLAGGEGAGWDARAVPAAQAECDRQRVLAGCLGDGAVAAGPDAGRLADGDGRGLEEQQEQHRQPDAGVAAPCRDDAVGCGAAGGVENSHGLLAQQPAWHGAGPAETHGGRTHGEPAGPSPSAWSDAVALACTDDKARRTQPGIFPLAHGVSGRVGRLRAYGNAIVPQVVATFLKAALEARP